MKCPTCQTMTKENYCMKCGTIILQDGSLGKINIEDKKTIYDDLEIFIGKNADKIIYKGFNLPAGIGAPFYLLYRKCYLAGTIIMILEYLLLLLYSNIINGPLLGIPFSLFLWLTGFCYAFHILLFGSITNQYYIRYAKNKISELKKSPTYESKDLQKHGGVGLLGLAIIPSLFGVIIIILMNMGIRII